MALSASRSPANRQLIANATELQKGLADLAAEAALHRCAGRSVVVVQGLGFVGAAVSAVIAGARAASGDPRYFVIGVDIPTAAGRDKVRKINAGVSPIEGPDQQLAELIAQGNSVGNLRATVSPEIYSLADVIVVDVPFDVRDRFALDPDALEVDLEDFQEAIRAIGRRMHPDAMVMIETTVPIGACRQIVLPILVEERARRGIHTQPYLAHSYERVMPGPNYVDSIRRYWRVFAGIDQASADRAREFLASFIETDTYELRQMEDTTSSELAKLLENSYRAANIAFIHEWTRLAEEAGVDLFKVIDAIRLRKGTHDNIRQPGFGVGGYCLTKDSLLAQWGAKELFASDLSLEVSLEALRINNAMPLHTLHLIQRLFDANVCGRTVSICGVSYLPDLADTRNSPTDTLVSALLAAGARVKVHDACVVNWPERPDIRVYEKLAPCLRGTDAIVFAVAHQRYLQLDPVLLLEMTSRSVAVVDACNVLSDAKAHFLHERGCRLLGVGKGHWNRRGYHTEALGTHASSAPVQASGEHENDE